MYGYYKLKCMYIYSIEKVCTYTLLKRYVHILYYKKYI